MFQLELSRRNRYPRLRELIVSRIPRCSVCVGWGVNATIQWTEWHNRCVYRAETIPTLWRLARLQSRQPAWQWRSWNAEICTAKIKLNASNSKSHIRYTCWNQLCKLYTSLGNQELIRTVVESTVTVLYLVSLLFAPPLAKAWTRCLRWICLRGLLVSGACAEKPLGLGTFFVSCSFRGQLLFKNSFVVLRHSLTKSSPC